MELVVLIIVIAVVFIYWNILKKNTREDVVIDKSKKEIERFKKYLVKREKLMTESERLFYTQLREYVDDTKCIIFSKVRLADIVSVKNQKYGESKVVFNTIKAKHIDFVVTDLSGNILKCIELDDPSHKEGNRNDWVKDTVCEVAGVDLTRIFVKEKYDFDKF